VYFAYKCRKNNFIFCYELHFQLIQRISLLIIRTFPIKISPGVTLLPDTGCYELLNPLPPKRNK
jgi:hypothetical protein